MLSVNEKGKFSNLRIKAGWIIEEIDRKPYTEKLLKKTVKGSKSYELTFEMVEAKNQVGLFCRV